MRKKFHMYKDNIAQMDMTLFRYLFWYVFALEYQDHKKTKVLEILRRRYIEKYGVFFSLNTKNGKYLDKIPFIFASAIIKTFFEVFPASRLIFTKEFLYKVFNIIFELQGIPVAKCYIDHWLQKFFTEDLLDFLSLS